MEFSKTLLFSLLYGAVSGSLSIALPLWLDSQGYSFSSIGYLFGLAALLSALIGIALAAWSDHLGRRLLISFYSACCAAGTGILAFFASPAAFVLGKSVSDFSRNNLWNTVLARISDLSGKGRRGQAIGTTIAVFALTYSLSHYSAGWMIEKLGFQPVFLFAIAASLAMAAIALAFNDLGKRKHRFHLSLNVLRGHDGRLNMLVSFLTGFTGITGIYVFYLFLGHHFGFGASQTGLIIAFLYVTWSVSSYLAGPSVDKMGIRKSMLLGATVNAAAWAGLIFFQDFFPFLFFMLVDNLCWPFYGLGASKLSSTIPEEENVGRDISIFGLAHVLGVICASFLGGVLAEMSFSYVFAIRAAAILLSGCIVFFLMRIKD